LCDLPYWRAHSWAPGPEEAGARRAYPPAMTIDAVLTIAALLSFLVLLVGWIGAPLRADAPQSLASAEAAASATAVAA
jgi:hypothetical protein